MDKKIINKEKILSLLKDISNDNIYLKKDHIFLISNLYKTIYNESLEKKIINEIIDKIQLFSENNILIPILINEIETFNEDNKKKIIKKENHEKYTIYEYEDKFTIFVKKKDINLNEIFEKTESDKISSIWIDDKKTSHELLIKKENKINFPTKAKKIVIYINK